MTPDGGNCDGLQTPYSRDLTGVGGFAPDFQLAGAALRVHFEVRFERAWWATYDSDPHRPLGLRGRNLSGPSVIAATASGGYPGPALAFLEPPRTFGLRVGHA